MKIKNLSYLLLLSSLTFIVVGCAYSPIGKPVGEWHFYHGDRVAIGVEAGKGRILQVKGNEVRMAPVRELLYLKFPGQAVGTSMDQITEEKIASLYGEPFRATMFFPYRQGSRSYTDGNAEFVFSEGRLVWFSVNQLSDRGEVGPWIGVTREGPFERVPLSRQAFTRFFGQADRKTPLNRL